jgi:5'-nucleotidase
VQKVLWNYVRDNRYIANPNGGSVHNRGAAVDITLVDKNGKEIPMPTDFDTFSKLADKDYSDVDKEKVKNAKLLESIMVKYGFESVYYEWWHFNDENWKSYAVVDKVLSNNINTAFDNTKSENSKITGDVSINSEPDFIEKIRAGISNLDIEKIKIAFDGDAVIFSDESESIYQAEGLQAFAEHERKNAQSPLPEGPFAKLLKTISLIQKGFSKELAPIRTALVTARNAPAHERVVRTLRAWDVRIDEAFFMGGIEKSEVLKAFGANIFFDDQSTHTDRAAKLVPAARVPIKQESQTCDNPQREKTVSLMKK